ncbi:hypothetical protein [Clostridium oceanicum]|uniref:Uncharacterized protein n=1 Tax=Clostridium oceanicum TaxID=1543 RepID=A0ABP3UPD2_9CLOT
MDCPFLSTLEESVECFKECALYKCDFNNGVCPFKAIQEKITEDDSSNYKELESIMNENFSFFTKSYDNSSNQYW